jgi:hypothetical protein
MIKESGLPPPVVRAVSDPPSIRAGRFFQNLDVLKRGSQ